MDQATALPGLRSAEAEARLAEVGANEPAPRKTRSTLAEVATLLANPLVVILLVAGVVSAFLGQIADATLIVVMVVLSLVLGFVQTYRSQRAAERLRDRVAPTATVLRDGVWAEIPRREVVPGDVFRLSAGDLVPADAELVEARDLHLHEALLTGESMPVEKRARDAVLLGTSVVSGTGMARVTATGPKTMFGGIAQRLASRAPQTEFEHGIRQFGLLILRAVVFLVLFILVISVALRRDAFESLLFAVALAVGLTPEFLPMITSVTLAQGAVRMARQKVIVKNLASIQNFGSIDVLCSDKTGTLTAGIMRVARSVDIRDREDTRALRLACVNSRFETGIRSPLDAAIMERAFGDEDTYAKHDEIPFDFERRCVSVVVDAPAERRLLIVKGAPEAILARATHYEEGGEAKPLTSDDRAACRATYERAGHDGFRVLAVAYRAVEARAAYAKDDERDLVLTGFVTFADPPLPDAREALHALARDGVRVKILTGDNEQVARHVCEEVGLDVREIVLGDAIDRMTDGALGQVAERVSVFARLSPAQKHRVLLALKHRGHVVGYLGDGINDAPSLHAADVGISVSGAVDVARDAAHIILLEPSLRALHLGILEGRKAFGNVSKYLFMGTSSNFGNMLSMAVASAALPFLPMLPTQILLNNLLYDLAQITIPSDNVDASFVRSPQRWDIRTVQRFMLLIGPVSSIYDFLTFFILLRVFHAGETLFHTGWFVESLATQTLVLFVIRTRESPLASRPSRPLALTIVGIVLFAIALPFTPLAPVLGFEPLPASFFAFLAAATITYLILVERVKRIVLRARTRVSEEAHAAEAPMLLAGSETDTKAT